MGLDVHHENLSGRVEISSVVGRIGNDIPLECKARIGRVWYHGILTQSLRPPGMRLRMQLERRVLNLCNAEGRALFELICSAA